MARPSPSAPPAPVALPGSRAVAVLRPILIALAVVFPLGFLVLAIVRIGHPFELEWIEGGSLAMVRRLLHGQPLYAAPTLEYIPFNYTPLFYWCSAGLAKILGDSFVTLRLVAVVSTLACGALVYALVGFETGRREAGLLAACLFFATYRLAGAWMDVARSDTLSLAWMLGGVLLLRADPGRARGATLAGAAFALAFLAKQSAIVAAVPVAVWLLSADRVRGAAFTATLAAAVAGSTWALDAASDGWYRYYVFELAGRYPFDAALVARFWTRDLLGPLGPAVLAGLFAGLAPPAGVRAGRATTFAACAGLVLAAWSVRAYPAAFDNVLLPACAAAAVLLGLGWDAALDRAAGASRPGATAFVYVVAALQFAMLLYNPLRQLPDPGDVARGNRLVEGLRQSPGAALVPCHDYLTARAGKGGHFHEMAFMAVAKSGTGEVESRLLAEFRAALRERRWATIVLDKADWLWEEVERHYEPRVFVFPDDRGFWPVTGMRRRPEAIFVPRADSVRTVP